MFKHYETSDAQLASYLLYMGCRLTRHYIADSDSKRVFFIIDDVIDREDLAKAYHNMTKMSEVLCKRMFHSYFDVLGIIKEDLRGNENEKSKEKFNVDKRTDIGE